MKVAFKQIFKVLSSLRLTVLILAASLVLVFFGTLDQVQMGIRQAQEVYFESLIAVWQYPAFWPGGENLRWLRIPMLGGYLLGPLFVLNLVCAHFRYFRVRLALIGISAIHLGIILLLIGQFVSQVWQQDYYMWLDEGAEQNFIRHFHEDELYVVETKEGGKRGLYSISGNELENGELYSFAEHLPFKVRVKTFYPNAVVHSASGRSGHEDTIPADSGIGAQFDLAVHSNPPVTGNNARNQTTAVLEVVDAEGESHGTWLVSNLFEDRFPPQFVEIDGKSYELGLRIKRTYLPFTIKLLKFTHDKYPGTNIPSNFASRVQVTDHRSGEEREVLIYMNHPLRYEGLTFFQASFAKQDTASMFQIVRNPGWTIPYLSCLLVSFGLVFQFTYSFIKYRRKVAL